jgi:hypothetical protein
VFWQAAAAISCNPEKAACPSAVDWSAVATSVMACDSCQGWIINFKFCDFPQVTNFIWPLIMFVTIHFPAVSFGYFQKLKLCAFFSLQLISPHILFKNISYVYYIFQNFQLCVALNVVSSEN